MAIGKRIKEARLERSMTQEELAKLVGVTKGAIANYENNVSHPKEPVMYALINALGVDANFLFQDFVTVKEPFVTEREAEHIKKYRALDRLGKEAVDSILTIEHKRCTEEQPECKIIPFRRSLQAGTGMYLGPDEFETIYVQDNELTRRASYGVPVRGDSMEPKYHDGDVLLVERTPDIGQGEIGVFTLDGEGYVKKLGRGELISLNSAYSPIPMTEDIRCNGRVIGTLDPEWIVEE